PWRECASSPACRSLRPELVRGRRELDDAEVVAERVADAEVGAVVALGQLVGDLDALLLEVFVCLLDVARGEAGGETAGALADELADLLRGLRVHRRRAGDLEQAVMRWVPGARTVSQRITPRSMSALTSRPSLPT